MPRAVFAYSGETFPLPRVIARYEAISVRHAYESDYRSRRDCFVPSNDGGDWFGILLQHQYNHCYLKSSAETPLFIFTSVTVITRF